jgi:hypothetical protein
MIESREKMKSIQSPHRMPRVIGKSIGILFGLILITLGTAGTALASPSFSVELSSDSSTMSHSDERIEYTVKVKNVAPLPPAEPNAGSKLHCSRGIWLFEGSVNYSYVYQWVRNGVPLSSSQDAAHGSRSKIYTVQDDDEEAVLQCLVKGTNGSGSASFIAASQPPVVANPQPGSAPPAPVEPGSGNSRRPVISGTAKNAGDELICTAPSAWSGSPSWTFEWLRNGVAATAGEVTETTATTSKFKISASELETKAVFQCMATASNGGGTAVVESFPVNTTAAAPAFVNNTEDGPPAQSPSPSAPSTVKLLDNAVIGKATLEVELPDGEDTRAILTETASGAAWDCARIEPAGGDPAKAICTAPTELLFPQESYGDLKVVAKLGADASDLAVAKATVFGGGAPPASAMNEIAVGPPIDFGIEAFEASVCKEPPIAPGPGICSSVVGSEDYTQAGGHGFAAAARIELTKKRRLNPEGAGPNGNFAPIEQLKQVFADLPPGFVGSVQALPELCPSVEAAVSGTCPAGSRVGRAEVAFSATQPAPTLAVYALEPEFGTPVQLAINAPFENVYVVTPRLRPDDNYAITIESAPGPTLDLLRTTVTLCNFGTKSAGEGLACKKADEAGANPKPFFTNPPRCGTPSTDVRVNSWAHPDQFAESHFENALLTGCEEVEFDPTIEFQPKSSQADSPTGLDVDLTMPTEGLEDPDGIAQANLKTAKVTLPEGMSINATAGQGLAACTMAQIGFEQKGGRVVPNDSPVGCPDGSKIGTLEVDTPLIDETFEGDIYVAKQSDNPFGSLLATYFVIDSPKNGILVKLAGLVEPNPDTGQLEITFNDNPEVPFSSLRVNLPQGPRSPLLNPPMCGSYDVVTETSWNAKDPNNPTPQEIVKQTTTYDITSGPGGGPCPDGALKAMLSAGTENPVAGTTSPFVMRLSRDDGTQRIDGLTIHTPPGLTGYLRGVDYCPAAILSSISGDAGAGQGQIDSPSCPASSQVGTVIGGAGAGANPLYVDTGKVYLSGPYKGAPLSFAVVLPAVAGPIDLGNIVVRSAAYIDPVSAKITTVSDSVPTILHGILLDARDIRVRLDRPNFTLNPTNCEPMSVGVDVSGENGGSQSLSVPFQVGGCRALGFKPRVGLRLFGGVKRGKYQGLRAVVRPRAGDANIKRTVVRFPRSAFVAQEHIRTICTRVQWAADACPKGSIYGKAVAWSPLLDHPLRGNVFLRSSDNKLPDLVADLRGPAHQPIRIELVGRTDSVKGALRNTFDVVPDAPVSYFRLQLFGKSKGLIVNSRNICAHKYRARVAMDGQNGRRAVLRPVLRSKRCAKNRRVERSQHRLKGHHRQAR